ncbi:MAG: hypothetical protein HYW50_02855 [Candidatus Diapherotrites archaeon]|nr:hypothetical protein [Candidatus Diapherotrites archaeon]
MNENLKFPPEMHCSESYNITKNHIVEMPAKYEIDKSIIEQEYFKNNKSQEEIANKFGVSKTKLTKNTALSNHYALRYRGKNQAMKIFDWLYLNKKHSLKRKYKKYLEIKRRRYLFAE